MVDDENIVYILEAILYIGADMWANNNNKDKVLKQVCVVTVLKTYLKFFNNPLEKIIEGWGDLSPPIESRQTHDCLD